MPWCPKCNELRTSYPDTRGDSVAVPTTSERYNRYGEYIGYEEGESFKTRIRTIPRCEVCNRIFECPNATSKEEYFYAKKQLLVDRLRAKKPNSGSQKWETYLTVFIVGFIVGAVPWYFISENASAGTITGFAVGIGGVILWAVVSRRKEKIRGRSTTPEEQAWQSRLNELQSLPYTEENYRRLIKQ
jgi:hypothetical protein